MLKHQHQKAAFTLVEMLVVITIISIMMSLALPAVINSRETARIAQCQHNLGQVGIAAQAHMVRFQFYPSNGWGNTWVGDPGADPSDRTQPRGGYGRKQPGSWIYALLPFWHLDNIRDIGRDSETRQTDLVKLQQQIITFLICNTRRRAVLFPLGADGNTYNAEPLKAGDILVAKTDYVINAGIGPLIGTGSRHLLSAPINAPATWNFSVVPTDGSESPFAEQRAIVDLKSLPEVNLRMKLGDPAFFNGISTIYSEVRQNDLVDGVGQTIFAGEKFMYRDDYTTGTGDGDAMSLYHGHDNGTARWGGYAPLRDMWRNEAKQQNPSQSAASSAKPQQEPPYRFGSAHAIGANFVFCDGSVRTIKYSIDGAVFPFLCNRADTILYKQHQNKTAKLPDPLGKIYSERKSIADNEWQ